MGTGDDDGCSQRTAGMLREIDNRILRKRIGQVKRELLALDAEAENHLVQLRAIRGTYAVVLQKHKPVGSPANAIRYLKRSPLN